MPGAFKYLVVADESAEFPAALGYAAQRARLVGGSVVMLCVVAPTEPAEWVSVSEEIRRQAAGAAEALTQRFAAEVWAETGQTIEIVIREGEIKSEIKRLIDADKSIKILVLGSASGSGAPGPLVTMAAKGQSFGGRLIPVLIVPGALTKDDVRALAEPSETAPAG